MQSRKCIAFNARVIGWPVLQKLVSEMNDKLISDDLWEIILSPRFVVEKLVEEHEDFFWSRSSFLFNLMLVSKSFKAIVDADKNWKVILGISVFNLRQYQTPKSLFVMHTVMVKLFEKRRTGEGIKIEFDRFLLSKGGCQAFNNMKFFVCCFLKCPLPHMQFENLPIVAHDFTKDLHFFKNPQLSGVEASNFDKIESTKDKAKFLAIMAAAQCSYIVGFTKNSEGKIVRRISRETAGPRAVGGLSSLRMKMDFFRQKILVMSDMFKNYKLDI